MPITANPRAQDLLAQMSTEMYRRAYAEGVSLSAYLESQDPSAEYNDGLDAFSRLMAIAGIRCHTREEYGVRASTFAAFEHDDHTLALFPEWAARQWRRAALGRNVSTAAMYSSSDQPAGSVSNPVSVADGPRTSQIAPAIPLSEIVAITTSIDSTTYDAFYLTDDTDETRMRRVAEGTNVPLARLTGGDHTIKLRKFGRGLEWTYEQMRNKPIDMIALHIARLAVQSEDDKLAAALDVLINGDGNSGTAAINHNLTALDPATTANNLTLIAWLAFKMKFKKGYMLTHVISQDGPALKLLTLNAGNANIQLVMLQGAAGFGSFRQINAGLADGVGLGWTDDAPANVLTGFDRRFAIERVTQIGSSITETDKFIRRQTQELIMTETEGYAKFDANAARTLNLAA